MSLMTPEKSRNQQQIDVREVSDERDLEQIFVIRDKVFVSEQHLTGDTRHDPDDRRSIHYLVQLAGTSVGTGRLTLLGKEAQIAWVAILPEYRGIGAGWAVMEIMIDRARDEEAEYIILNAQIHAREFYERLGFRAVGDEFSMARIVHQVMIRSLTPGGNEDVMHYFGRFGAG